MQENKILIIDDEPGFLKTAQAAFKDSYDVVIASNEKDAIEKAKTVNPEAIILGYLEPRGTAFEIHNKLRDDDVTRNIPLLIVDVKPEEHSRRGWTRHQGLRMNADDYISKPVDKAEILDIIERIIRRASTEPMGLKEASQHMERALERINKIEELLIQ